MRWKFRLPRSGALLTGGLILVLVIAGALLANLLYPGDPQDMVGPPTLWPGVDPRFPLGTDMMGRDMTAELLHGAEVSLSIGVSATVLAIFLGTVIGLISGYVGSKIDHALMRVTEIFQTMPPLLFTIALVIIFSPSSSSIALAIGLTSWPQIARLVRAEAMRVRQYDFIAAAVTIGMNDTQVALRHVLPNSLTPMVGASSILVGQVILTDAALSFMGLADPNVVSWGAMVGAGRETLRTAWYMTAIPGAAIFITVIAFMFIGNGMNDLLNPRGTVR